MPRQSTAPITFFALVLPYGITSGFISVNVAFCPRKGGLFHSNSGGDSCTRRLGQCVAFSLGTCGGPFSDGPTVVLHRDRLFGHRMSGVASKHLTFRSTLVKG